MKLFNFFALLCIPFCLSGNNEITHKEVNAYRTSAEIVIDGNLDESDWEYADLATDFTQLQPNPGLNPSFNSTVKILYNDDAIYIGAFLFDEQPDSISQELSERDNFANTDWFGIIIDTYKSGINGFSFAVTPTGIQSDARLENDGDDDDEWDAVWESNTKIVENGWIAEIKIPYSALRFPKVDEQNWYINFGREIRRFREESFWNPIDPQIDQFLSQSGILKGITDIKPPIRLSAFPFIAAYAENYKDRNASPRSTWGRTISGGMDVKLGISESFTLDMTLIPDFGQVQSDNVVLNLSPFEVQFDDNRQFFTEGTEIFNKADLFYSRRVGGRPLNYDLVEEEIRDGEEIISNPSETQLINATKVSGRTKGGTGIGIFNAVSGSTQSIVKSSDGSERAIETSPLTNYSVLVFDQQLKYNSYFSLINTNVWRSGLDYEANVTGGEFRLQNRKRSHAFFGQGSLSQKYAESKNAELGEAIELGIEKISGNIQWNLEYDYKSEDYDINDLGLIRTPNKRELSGRVSYNKYTPFGPFNRMGIFLFSRYTRLAEPNVFNDFNLFLRSFFRTKSFWGTGLWVRWEPINTNDYFEPRTSDFSRFYNYPKNLMIGTFVSSNYNKRFAIDLNLRKRWFNEDGRTSTSVELEPRFRVNNRWNLRWSVENEIEKNDVGYVDEVDNQIIFGIRDRKTIVNLVQSNFAFNKNTSLSFRLRHYWSNVKYNTYKSLSSDGQLLSTDYQSTNNNNFNAFTIDMVGRWRFAPGSDIYLVWKNSVFSSDELIEISYFRNVDGLFQNPISNSFSIKCIYFLDYLSLKKKRTS